jgi:hypothetical protein
MAGRSRWSLLLGLLFLAFALAEAWPLHASTSILRPVLIVLAAFVAGARLGPFLPGGLL